MSNEQKKHDGVVLFSGLDGAWKELGYTRVQSGAEAPPLTGFGGHVDDDPAFVLDFKIRELRSE